MIFWIIYRIDPERLQAVISLALTANSCKCIGAADISVNILPSTGGAYDNIRMAQYPFIFTMLVL